ncbi:hypothetical protein G7046_g5251 [Stylonectria norvegica]|nr:hypothetical protein G7046_g5251 [Stylonectria norvegica]
MATDTSAMALAPTPQAYETVRFHQNGDVALVVHGSDNETKKRFIVSSDVLSGASEYFAVLLGPNFKEGRRLRQEPCPDIDLKDDDPDAMHIILACLHHKVSKEHRSLKPRMIARVAFQSDKYGCVEALYSWFLVWYTEYRSYFKSRNIRDNCNLMAASYFTKDKAMFVFFSENVVLSVSNSFAAAWPKDPILSALPQTISEKFDYLRAQSFRIVQRVIGEVEGALQKSHFRDSECTPLARVADYFAILRKYELWPFGTELYAGPLDSFKRSLREVTKIQHQEQRLCNLVSCPLKQQLSYLRASVNLAISVEINKGLRELRMPGRTSTQSIAQCGQKRKR